MSLGVGVWLEAGEVTWGLAGLPGYAALMECPLPGTVQRLSPVVSLALYTAPAWRQKVGWGGRGKPNWQQTLLPRLGSAPFGQMTSGGASRLRQYMKMLDAFFFFLADMHILCLRNKPLDTKNKNTT